MRIVNITGLVAGLETIHRTHSALLLRLRGPHSLVQQHLATDEVSLAAARAACFHSLRTA